MLAAPCDKASTSVAPPTSFAFRTRLSSGRLRFLKQGVQTQTVPPNAWSRGRPACGSRGVTAEKRNWREAHCRPGLVLGSPLLVSGRLDDAEFAQPIHHQLDSN